MPPAPKRRRLRRGPIAEAVDTWLPAELQGADRVRAAVVRQLALQLDSNPPAYEVSRIANSMLAAVASIEAEDPPDARAEVRALLRQVMP